jgi:hypothetical protein
VSKQPISIVQRGNLRSLEETLRKQWRLGQNIVLCWCWDERGLLVIFVPHYFLGNFCAVSTPSTGRSLSAADGAAPAGTGDQDQGNEAYVRDLISGRRRKSREELFAIAVRLGVSPTFIKLSHPLEESAPVMGQVEEIIRRYGLSYVRRRAVLLFDITDFSLFSSFEQASQLNSLSYSMNAAYNKLSGRGVYINFARTTTGDGYYVWNRDRHETSDRDLFLFLLLTLADNTLARAASRGNTVPVIRAAFHIGSHYELYQAEGVNPTMFSYIVGDVTIELARIVEKAKPLQVMLGDFATREGHADGSAEFVRHCAQVAAELKGLQFMDRPLTDLRCWLSRDEGDLGGDELLDVMVTDKHGLKHHAFNLQAAFRLGERDVALGLTPEQVNAARSVRAKGKNPLLS